MKISTAFNRYYHAVLNDLFEKLKSIQIVFLDSETGETKVMIDDDTGKVFTLYKMFDFDTMDEIKQLLKKLNINYPVDAELSPLSTTKVDNNALLQHLLTIEEIAKINGVELDHLKRERELFMKLYVDY